MTAILKQKACPNKDCKLHGLTQHGNIRTHGWYKTKNSKRRRYICNTCGVTFGSTHGSAYYRLRASIKEVE